MLIGNGMMAKQFEKYNSLDSNIVIFASGVPNSQESRQSEFDREARLLLNTIQNMPDKHLVYFSTCSMYDPIAKTSLYVKHKIAMENMIKQNAKNFHIFRISQIIGRANNNTLINFLIDNIIAGKIFEIWVHATRNFISIQDVYKIVDYILSNNSLSNKIINIANPHNISIVEFLHIVEEVLGTKAKIKLMDNGVPYDKIDIADIHDIINSLQINFNSSRYLIHAIRDIIDIDKLQIMKNKRYE